MYFQNSRHKGKGLVVVNIFSGLFQVKLESFRQVWCVLRQHQIYSCSLTGKCYSEESLLNVLKIWWHCVWLCLTHRKLLADVTLTSSYLTCWSTRQLLTTLLSCFLWHQSKMLNSCLWIFFLLLSHFFKSNFFANSNTAWYNNI